MTKRIQEAIDILLDAVNNNTLIAGDCTKCAVGNLIAAGLKGQQYDRNTLNKTRQGTYINWTMLFATSSGEQQLAKNPEKILKKYPIIKEQIESTEFTIKELAEIEYAFEITASASHDCGFHSEREYTIQGIAAVVEVMLGFDECKETVKEVFTDKILIKN